ncbi:hypothetical protein GGR21_004165 [Dysgonomonas hofstadii]|uniref:DUF3800 domain-containing protein n=1 Tax=Dysgonomonas hofstadii TaxID=637886 RepID=A0A840D1N1_9BACT|nr:DUF3800 domain-containing protein [Dysgonomonas hofstadii]MBB4038233.1 hypothetical protein [Dysgonomonas hofstadii]
MIDFEVNEIRTFIRLSNPTLDFDSSFTFYYDETNNIKTFYVREDGFNYSFHSNFVLGGVLYEGDKPQLDDIFHGLRLQPNVKEVKLKHIAHGEFQDCLKSTKLDAFLKKIIDAPVYLHYTSLNFLYWSIADIVDSAIVNSKIAQQLGMPFANKLKNDLYFLCKCEIEDVIAIFSHYKYPNLRKEDIIPFINSLSQLFVKYEDDFNFHFGLTSLKQILRESEKKESLPFIMDEKDHVLLENFTHFYLAPLYKFKNSNHIFDNENDIQTAIGEHRLLDNGVEFKNYIFEDSQNDVFIQVSDVLVGLVGKMTSFINTHTHREIREEIGRFNDIQLVNLDNYLDLLNKSDFKNKAFLHNVDSYEEVNKMQLISDIRSK